MLERQSWLTPWLDGQPRLRKPPLLYWAILLTYKLLGINLFAARVWGVLFGAGLAACSCLIYRELFGTTGFLAGLITLASLGVAYQSRIAMLDIPLGLFVSLAVLFALRWGRTGGWTWILLAAAALGLSSMMKGPIGFFFFAAAAVPALWAFRKWRFALSRLPQILGAVVLLLAISFPWPLYMAVRWPQFFAVLGEEIGARRLGSVFAGYPLAVLAGALGLVFPWSGLLVAAIARGLGPRRVGEGREGRWLVAWYLCGTIPFFFMRAFEWYLTPMLPAMGMLAANWLQEAREPLRRTVVQASLLVMALSATLICIPFLWFGLGVVPAALSLGLSVGLVWIALRRPDSPIGVGAVGMLLTGLLGGVYPSLGVNAMPPHLEGTLGSSAVAVYGSDQPALLPMRLGRSVVRIGPAGRDGARSLRGFEGFVFVDGEGGDFEVVAQAARLRAEAVGEFKSFRLGWKRFGRKGATLEDWKAAFQTRSLDDLGSVIRLYRVSPKPALGPRSEPPFSSGVVPDSR
jgi:4-amino-4-deoxy-L-arabinose transferase-like glycosyltransferase